MLVLILALGAVLAGLFPLTIVMGYAAGGVLDSGQAEPARWWLGCGIAFILYGMLSWRWPTGARLWWLLIGATSLLSAILAFSIVASSGQARLSSAREASFPPPRIGVVSALPFFRAEGVSIAEHIAGKGERPNAPVTHHPAHAIDHIDAASLKSVDSLLVAQPRLLQPEELVALDGWVRAGGKAVILADPLLIWHSDFALGDPRRPPMTSLLDPLLSHWGLRLLPAPQDGPTVRRHMLVSGHVLLLSGASRFARNGLQQPVGVSCHFAEQGLMAVCRIGKGQVRLIADADMLDERLWLADPRWPDRAEAWAADVPALMDHWLVAPLSDAVPDAPCRVIDEQALPGAMRTALIILLVWAGMGWAGAYMVRKLWVRMGRAGHGADSYGFTRADEGQEEATLRTKGEQSINSRKGMR